MNTKSLPHLSKRKLFQKLLHKSYYLKILDVSGASGSWRLFKSNPYPASQPIALIEDKIVQSLLADGTLILDQNEARLSEAGHFTIKRTLSLQGSFRAQHQVHGTKVLSEENLQKEVLVNLAESPLSWLARRKDQAGQPLLDPYHIAAGERLRSDFERAQLSPKVTRDYDHMAMAGTLKTSGQNGFNVNETVLEAKQRLYECFSVIGQEFASILLDVCCEHRGLEETEKRNNLPRRSGKIILRMALNQLARHYGLISIKRSDHRIRQRIEHWGVDDYRPSIDG